MKYEQKFEDFGLAFFLSFGFEANFINRILLAFFSISKQSICSGRESNSSSIYSILAWLALQLLESIIRNESYSELRPLKSRVVNI